MIRVVVAFTAACGLYLCVAPDISAAQGSPVEALRLEIEAMAVTGEAAGGE